MKITRNMLLVLYCIGGVFIGLVFLVLIFFLLNHFHSFSARKPVILQHISSLSSPQVKKITVDICTKQTSLYPLQSDILTTRQAPDLGVFQGIINNIDKTHQLLSIASTPSGHIFAFNMKPPAAIYDYHSKLISNVSLIPTGTRAVISFPCLQNSITFELTKIQLVK